MREDKKIELYENRKNIISLIVGVIYCSILVMIFISTFTSHVESTENIETAKSLMIIMFVVETLLTILLLYVTIIFIDYLFDSLIEKLYTNKTLKSINKLIDDVVNQNYAEEYNKEEVNYDDEDDAD